MFSFQWARAAKRRRCSTAPATSAVLLVPGHFGWGCQIEPLEFRCLLAAQVIAAIPASVRTNVRSVVSFEVQYSTTNPVNAKTTGASFRMHYNSTELTPNISAITATAFSGATIQDRPDNSNFDSDTATDRFVNFLWTDIQGRFPLSTDLPVILMTATFSTSDVFNGDTVRFTGSPPLGFSFSAAAVPISLNSTTPSLTIGDATLVDEGGSATFPVTLSAAAPAGGVTVTYSTADDSATGGLDYTAKVSQTITIAEGQNSGNITVETQTDGLAEGTETFRVNITGATGVSLTDSTAVGTIRNVNANGQTIDFDIDGNGQRNPFQDAVLIFAWMSPGTPDAVFQKFIDANGTRKTPAAVRQYLDNSAGVFDIDLNGSTNPFQDAVLVFAWMSQGTPDSVLQTFIASTADPSRNTAAEARSYLDGLQSVGGTAAPHSVPSDDNTGFFEPAAGNHPSLFNLDEEKYYLLY